MECYRFNSPGRIQAFATRDRVIFGAVEILATYSGDFSNAVPDKTVWIVNSSFEGGADSLLVAPRRTS